MFKLKCSSKSGAKSAKKQQAPVFRQVYFDDKKCHRTYCCIHCRAHLASHDELISKLFQGNHGRAYLFNKVVNVGCKQAVERELLTGLHAVADIYCDSCQTTIGWKYEQAFVASQKYKEGKYIVELIHMLKENNWDLNSYNANEILASEYTNELAGGVPEVSGTKSRLTDRQRAASFVTHQPTNSNDTNEKDNAICFRTNSLPPPPPPAPAPLEQNLNLSPPIGANERREIAKLREVAPSVPLADQQQQQQQQASANGDQPGDTTSGQPFVDSITISLDSGQQVATASASEQVCQSSKSGANCGKSDERLELVEISLNQLQLVQQQKHADGDQGEKSTDSTESNATETTNQQLNLPSNSIGDILSPGPSFS